MLTLVTNHLAALHGLEIRVGDHGPRSMTIAFTGDIDCSNAAGVLEMMLHRTKDFALDVTLDASAVGYIDSRGISTLVHMQRRAVRNGSTLRILLGDNLKLKRLFDIVKLDRLLTLA